MDRSSTITPVASRSLAGTSAGTDPPSPTAPYALLNTISTTSLIYSVAISSDGTRIVSGSTDNSVRVWDASSGVELKVLKGHTNKVYSVAFSSDGTRIVSGSFDKSLRVWDASSGAELRVLKGHSYDVCSVAFSSDGTRIVSGSEDNTLRVWDASSGAELKVLKGHTNFVHSVAFSSDGTRIVSGSYDKSVRVWDTSSGALLKVLNGHTSMVYSVAFSSDGTRIVSSSADNSVRVWDASSGAELKVLNGHTNIVLSVAFSSDGARIVSGSEDKSVRVWDALNGAELKVLNGHTEWVHSIAFAADGTRIVSGSGDGSVRVWNASSGAELKVPQDQGARGGKGTMGESGSNNISGSRTTLNKLLEEIQSTKAKLRKLEDEFLRAQMDTLHPKQTCLKFDSAVRTKLGHLLEYSESQEHNSGSNILGLLDAAQVIISEAGVMPLMDVVDKIQVLHGEMEKISDVLARDLRHFSFELFEEELDQCYQESASMVGAEFSTFLMKVSEIEDLNESLIKTVIQVFMVSFCVSQWQPYFDKQHHPVTAPSQDQSRDPSVLKRLFLKQLTVLFKVAAWSILDSKLRSAFGQSLAPFFEAMDKTTAALDNIPKSMKVQLSVVGPLDIDDFTDVEVCAVGMNIKAESTGTSDEKIMQEFAKSLIVGTIGIGVYFSMGGTPQLRNLLPRKVIASSAALNQILDAQVKRENAKVERGHSDSQDGRDA